MPTLKLAIAVSFVVCCVTFRAQAEEKRQPKALTCSAFETIKSGSKTVGICYDGKKPAVWTSWAFIDLTDPNGDKRRFAVGFR